MPRVREPLLEPQAQAAVTDYDGGRDAVDALALASLTYGEQLKAAYQRIRRQMSERTAESEAETWYRDEILAHRERYSGSVPKETYLGWYRQGMWDAQTRSFSTPIELQLSRRRHLPIEPSPEQRERARTIAETCQRDVDELKLAHPGEVTPEVELRMLALGEMMLPLPGMSPRDWLEHLFERALSRPGSQWRPPTLVTSSTAPITSLRSWHGTPWEPPLYYGTRTIEEHQRELNERIDHQQERNDIREQIEEATRDSIVRNMFRRFALPGPEPPVAATAEDAPTPPKPVEFRVAPPTSKRRISIEDEE